MRDVVPPNERSIRNIPLPAHRRHHVEETLAPEHHDVPPNLPDEPMFAENRPRRRKPLLVWIIAAIIIGVGLAAGLAYMFAGATVEAYPKRLTVTVTEPIVARLDAPLNIMPFETVTQSEVGSRTVPTSGEAKVDRRASGTIAIQNAYSTAPQRLIKNTRFEATNGKIYRINESVDVPGGKKRADGSLEPGVAEVMVFADSPGDEYNQAPTRFTVPGFKGDPRYEKFTASSKSPLAGGFSGVEKVVSNSDMEAAYKSIEVSLTDLLKERLQAAVPPGYVLVKNSERVNFEELPRGGDPNGGAVLSKRATATAAMVQVDILASAILKQSDSTLSGEPVKIEGAAPEIAAKSALSSDLKGDLSISIEKPVTLVWQFDQEALRKMLVGVNLDALAPLINDHFKPALESATVSIRPFWKKAFPSNPDDITIKIMESAK